MQHPRYPPPRSLPSGLSYVNAELHIEGVRASALVAAVGTPAYVYSQAAIEQHFLAYRQGLLAAGFQQPLVCYAVKVRRSLDWR
jgi:diaminopimelate decarboxylase